MTRTENAGQRQRLEQQQRQTAADLQGLKEAQRYRELEAALNQCWKDSRTSLGLFGITVGAIATGVFLSKRFNWIPLLKGTPEQTELCALLVAVAGLAGGTLSLAHACKVHFD